MTTKRDASSDSDSDARRERKKRKKEKKERKKEKKERKRRKHEQQNTASDDEAVERFRREWGRERKPTASERETSADHAAESRLLAAAASGGPGPAGMEQHDVETLVPRETGSAAIGQDRAARRAIERDHRAETAPGGLCEVGDDMLYGGGDDLFARRRAKAASSAARVQQLVEEARRARLGTGDARGARTADAPLLGSLSSRFR